LRDGGRDGPECIAGPTGPHFGFGSHQGAEELSGGEATEPVLDEVPLAVPGDQKIHLAPRPVAEVMTLRAELLPVLKQTAELQQVQREQVFEALAGIRADCAR